MPSQNSSSDLFIRRLGPVVASYLGPRGPVRWYIERRDVPVFVPRIVRKRSSRDRRLFFLPFRLPFNRRLR